MPDAIVNDAGVWGHRVGFGQRPALLLIDFVQAYTLPASPLFAQGVVSAVQHSTVLLASARAAGVPVLHTTIAYHSGALADGGAWFRKS
ncbi:MAG TPA: isochorismatase, partial [Pseudorhodoferax sp.]|nr:isochorismatase [Pseudorhodoferax sp.]